MQASNKFWNNWFIQIMSWYNEKFLYLDFIKIQSPIEYKVLDEVI